MSFIATYDNMTINVKTTESTILNNKDIIIRIVFLLKT